jgi:hypothetical protein
MKVKYFGKLLIIGVIFASLIAGAGCSSKPQSKPVPKAPSPPGELKQLQTSLDELYNILKPESPGKAEGGQKKEQQSQEKEGDQQGDKKGKQAEETKKQAPTGIDWSKLQAQAEKIHDQWNSFEPKVVQAGARPENITGMEKELDTLAIKIAARDRSGVRLAANSAAGYLPDFMELYAELYAKKVQPDLYRMRVMTRDVLLRVDDGDWAAAEQDMLKMKTTWSKLLVQLEDTSKTETDKTHLSLLDLEGALGKRDQVLVLIKGNILEKNLDGMIKSQEMKM